LQGRPREIAERAEKLANTGRRSKIVGRNGEEYVLLDLSEVLAFQAEGEQVWIVAAKARYLATQPLRHIEERLNHLFFQRVHRNAIVNVNHVRKMSVLSSQRWLLTLSNGLELVVSKRQAHNVRDILQW
jgi:two-component system LytT family response regulator